MTNFPIVYKSKTVNALQLRSKNGILSKEMCAFQILQKYCVLTIVQKRTTANNELDSIREVAIELPWWTHSSFIFNSWEFRCIQALCPVLECIASKVGIRGLQDWNFYLSFSRSAFASPYFCELSESRLKSKKQEKKKKYTS